ncbi:MAG: C39 family peptidase [Victivallales bacterium]|nr:C39 family peptidase [Victivallales bacterium]
MATNIKNSLALALMIASMLSGVFLSAKKPAAKLETWQMDPLLKRNLWEITPQEFLDEKLFKWTSTAKNMLRYSAAEFPRKITLFDIELAECLISIKDKKVAAMKFLFYSRGDKGAIGKEEYGNMLSTVDTAINKDFGKSTELPPKRLMTRMSIYQREWIKEPYKLRLIWSYMGNLDVNSRVEFTPEYISLVISNSNKDDAPKRVDIDKDPRDKYALNVKRTDDGDVYIDNVPMVDQGRKGYCVAATSERVLKYFGQDVDQHVIAQISGTTADRGTQLDNLFDAMNDVERKLGINVKSLYRYKPPQNIAEIKKIINSYNRIAKKEKQAQIRMSDITEGRRVYTSRAFNMMKKDVWLKTRVEMEKNDMRRFQRDIVKYINKGYPCVWSVMLGLVKEKEIPQARGGHQRLIIGYNEKKNTIIYSDSWGQGHEKKEMDIDDAWGITQSLDLYLPRCGRYNY